MLNTEPFQRIQPQGLTSRRKADKRNYTELSFESFGFVLGLRLYIRIESQKALCIYPSLQKTIALKQYDVIVHYIMYILYNVEYQSNIIQLAYEKCCK